MAPSLAKSLVYCICFIANIVARTNGECGGKTVLTELTGVVSSGGASYPENTLCEWLIQGPAPNMTITLSFTEYDTECSYDFLFIHDGPTYSSPLIASFSGNRKPPAVAAHSGMMLINLYSDTNYVRPGFVANYTIEHCVQNCSGHGKCVNGHCVCDRWKGDACDLKWCPSHCNQANNQGDCDFDHDHCVCRDGFIGESCSYQSLTDKQANSWFSLAQHSPVFTPRTGHAGVYISETDTLWVFGGFSLKNVHQELLTFNFTTSQWEEVATVGSQPSGRHSHTLCRYRDGLILFGGELSDERLTNELWLFNLTTGNWSLLSVNDSHAPPPTAHHTANIVDDQMIVFGGRTDEEPFSSAMYTYSLAGNATGWRRVGYQLSKDPALGVMGHSSVFHPGLRTLVVFGGFRPVTARSTQRSGTMYAFHVDERVWSEWRPNGGTPPQGRAFQSMQLAGDYLIIFGGNVHRHNYDETCYANQLYFYNLNCHEWISTSVFQPLSPPSADSAPPRGRFSHVSVLRGSNGLIVLGGYAGVPLGDMHAYKLPRAVASSNASAAAGSHCSEYGPQSSCTNDPACAWCDGASKCMAVQDGGSCQTKVKQGSACRGLCATLAECGTCLAWRSARCGWCVQDSRCYSLDSPGGACAADTSPVQGWWGSSAQFLTAPSQCVSENFPPGMTVLSYISPPDPTAPDGVSIISRSSDKFSWGDFSNKRYLAHVYPFVERTAPWKVKLYVSSSIRYNEADLELSTDDTRAQLENVASCRRENCDKVASRSGGQPIFPSPHSSQKYHVQLSVDKDVVPVDSNAELIVSMEWNGTESEFDATPFPGHFLKPFSDGNCSAHSNCLSCMTDASCGWCELSRACVARNVLSVCQGGGHSEMLVLNATQCISCPKYLDCFSCAQDSNCAWGTSASCKRRGLLTASDIKDPGMCEDPCYRRNTCSSCVESTSGCGWCEQTSKCFLFSSYTAQYAYGQCSHWADRTNPRCVNCSEHVEFRPCLEDIKCGWCGDDDDPRTGSCFSGGFLGPDAGNCSALFPRNGSVSWSYVTFPDVDECRLDIDDCHANATCTNTPDAFTCACVRGYNGTGKQCSRTCYHDCGAHGTCNMQTYACDCDLGWLGDNCTVDCGCHGHSWCPNGIGVCDNCQENTHGDHCEFCLPGSYGNATTSEGCLECDCHGHGDESLGRCDTETGKCYCVDGTRGDRCEQCVSGLKGNPSSGGNCYHACESQRVLTNTTRGYISSLYGSGATDRTRVNCVWVISASDNSSHDVIFNPGPPITGPASITLAFTGLSLDCSTGHVEVYDGLPPAILASRNASWFYQLGAFCGSRVPRPVTARLGNMVVRLSGSLGDAPAYGFKAKFTITKCPDDCPPNGACVMTSRGPECQCQQGWTGALCDTVACPKNCSSVEGRGECNQASLRCDCVDGFTGPSCSDVIAPGGGLWELIHNLSSASGPRARMGHVVATSAQALFVHGGLSLAHGALSDVWKFDVNSSSWELVTTHQAMEQMPPPRFFHAGVLHQIQSTLVVHGGMTSTGPDNSTWLFNVSSREWSQSSLGPTVAGHASVLVDDVMIVVGGYSPELGFNEKTFQYHVINRQWSQRAHKGAPHSGLIGHTAVFHADTGTILVFGGQRFFLQWVKPSEVLYSLHVPTNTWSILQALPASQPAPKFFHVAAMVGDVMLIYGGRSNTADQYFSSDLLAYEVKCNQWHSISADAIKGTPPGGLVSAAAGAVGRHVYLFGGFSGHVHDEMYRVTLPTNFCNTILRRSECTSTIGCSWCQLHSVLGNVTQPTNQSACYPVGQSVPAVCHAVVNITLVEFENGSACNSTVFARRACDTYHQCSACVASFPGAHGASGSCQWCYGCSNDGKCVSPGTNCDQVIRDPGCRYMPWTKPEQCIENGCEASTCAECTSQAKPKCVWTPQLLWKADGWRTVGGDYPWSCFLESTSKKPNVRLDIVSPPQPCPAPCTRHADCQSCLNSKGGDGGWDECVWSVRLGTCFSPSYIPLRCAGGACGRIVRGKSQLCPSCSQASCAACLDSGCGWCSRQGFDGIGSCMVGGLQGPLHGTCEGNTIEPKPPGPALNTTGPPVWATTLCPMENECENGRHTCNGVGQTCVDTPESYDCDCRPGYAGAGPHKCEPVCEQGCVQGECDKPNVCTCRFGWTSPNCSLACQCNGHGQCVNHTHLDTCHSCQNNTVGSRCEWCAPLFVGDARNNGTCKTCHEVCNKSADVCMSKAAMNESRRSNRSLEMADVEQWLDHGPREIAHDGECVCLRNSRGVKCKSCIEGFFFLEGTCSRCLCNGHGNICDKRGNCQCRNNTVKNCDDRDPEECYKYQCASCNDNFMGSPTDSRQCYRKISVMQEFFIGATYEEKPELLPPQRAIFFAVYPKFTNVDIRMTVDIFQGEVDVYVTSSKRAFIVKTSNVTGAHEVTIAEKAADRRRRDAETPAENVLELTASKDRLNNFVVFTEQDYALVVRSLGRRLVITFPHENHKLRDTRFYLLFRTSSRDAGSRGVVYFRQDLAQIDLFVFFSVFFSVFFLTMSFCVLVWKVKIYVNRRQMHHVQTVELENRRSRPFATYAFLYGNKEPRRSFQKRSVASSKPLLTPLARQPVGDGRAALLTVMFQMPGNECSEFQLALGSALTLVSGQHTLATHANQLTLQNGHKIMTRHSRTITS